ncbi:UNVERIFIED_ORG: hypothetical protein GGD48_004907 [Rhizobium etli]
MSKRELYQGSIDSLSAIGVDFTRCFDCVPHPSLRPTFSYAFTLALRRPLLEPTLTPSAIGRDC